MIRTLFFTPRALSALSLITARPVIRVRKLSLTCAHQVSQLLSSVSPGWEETNTTQYLLLVTPQTASSRSFKSPQRWDEMSWDEMLDANVPSLSRIGSIRLGLWRRKNRVRRSKAYYGTELLTSVRVTFSSFVTGSKLQPVSPELRVWSRTRLSSPRWRRRRRREETCCVTLWSKSSEWWHRLTKITEKQKQKNNKQNKKKQALSRCVPSLSHSYTTPAVWLKSSQAGKRDKYQMTVHQAALFAQSVVLLKSPFFLIFCLFGSCHQGAI